jgi:hypothetical protein
MNLVRTISASLLFYFFMLIPVQGIAQREPAAAQTADQRASAPRDGQHDFDFNVGTWRTHIKRLLHPLTGSKTWVNLEGTVEVTKIWNGRGQFEEIEADGPTGHFEGLTVFLYNRENHQWNQYFANSGDGTLGQPGVGEFKNGRGEFFDQEMFQGRAILVRFVWLNIAPDAHDVEESFSDDGGKTWEPVFVASLTRENARSKAAVPSTLEDANHDFDFNFGTWKTHVSRLQHPLTGSNTWVEYEGTSVVRQVWGGRASVLELEVDGPAGHIEGVGFRLYNPQSHQWSLNWTNSTDAALTPMVGEFKNGQGEFFDQESFNGKTIFARNGFRDITRDSSRFEQAFSNDGGKTWETNWVMTFARAKDEH